ncbi:MAG: DUF4239 domain-containing protein [Actinobacteria bacterium]|nr:DUF4239 domain-containing protein [Actinomycetota bacterium]
METADRWLLNNLTTFELGCLIVGGGTFLSVLGFLAVRRLVSPETRIENNEVGGILLGLLGAFYGIVLGFAIVVLFEDFRAADQSVKDETTALAQLYRSADLFPAANRAELGKAIAQYGIAVREIEWPLLRDGHESLRAHNLLGTMYTDVEAVTPHGPDQQAFYAKSVDALSNVVTARRARLNASSESLPTPFQVLLLGGAVVTIGFLFFFGSPNTRAHALMVAAVAAVISFSLLLVLLLAFPFSGQVAVSNDPFKLGIIGRLDPTTGIPRQGPCDNCFGPP